MSYDNRYGCLKLYPCNSLDSIELTNKKTPIYACRKTAATIISRHRKELGYPVTIKERGFKWELKSDPEGVHPMGCNEGILKIVPVVIEEDDDWEFGEPVFDDDYETCEDCGEETHVDELTDGVCSACLDAYDTEEED